MAFGEEISLFNSKKNGTNPFNQILKKMKFVFNPLLLKINLDQFFCL